jgi:hypothetical protein
MVGLGIANALFYVSEPVTVMREKPTVESSVVSQAYFSEEVSLGQESGEWVEIQTKADGYRGWIKKNSVCTRTTPFPGPDDTVVKVHRCAAHLYDRADTEFGPMMTLPFDSRLVLDGKQQAQTQDRWIKVSLPDGRTGYIQRGDVSFSFTPLSTEEMCQFSKRFLDIPYTWGGRSSFGYDCSGFVQMLLRQKGVKIPRDSKDQVAWDGFVPVALDHLQPGDVLYWGLDGDKIRHTGMYLGNGEFIHATVAENAPYIRISKISSPEWDGHGRYKTVVARTLKK